MAQPVRKRKTVKIKPKMDGVEYCNECPFLGYDFEKGIYMCNPNGWIFGKTSDKIPVPSWCGNKKTKEMKKEYNIKSDRYGHTHKFVQTNDGLNLYEFRCEEEWMPISVVYNDGEKSSLKFIDPEGGPNIYNGWTNGEITVTETVKIGNWFYFKLKEN